MGHEFEIGDSVELATTPDQVWEAIATGPGVDSWFMGHTEIEPREGGTSRLVMGGQAAEATITAWQPGERFAYRTGTDDDGAFMAVDYLIEARDGGTTALRMVQSGVLSGDWETEYEALRVGWPLYFHTLAEYLRHFAPRTAVPVSGFRPDAGTPERVWDVLGGLLGSLAVGDRVRLAVPGAPGVDGVIDTADLRAYVGVRTDDGLYRFVHSGPVRGNGLLLGHHLFGTADAPAAESGWQDWLATLPLD